jgi:hypothetical protein
MAGHCSSVDEWSEAPGTCLMGLLCSSHHEDDAPQQQQQQQQQAKEFAGRPLAMRDEADAGFIEYDVQQELSPRTLAAVYTAAPLPLAESDTRAPRDQARFKPRFFRSVLPIEG